MSNVSYKEFSSLMTTKSGKCLVTEEMFSKLCDIGFFSAPASTKYHCNYSGGLYEHSLCVMNVLLDLTKRLNINWKDERSPYIIGMFHDLCKCDNYYYDESSKSYKYNNETYIKGHGTKSVILLNRFYDLNDEEIMCIIYHMGAFVDQDEWNDYTRAIHKYESVLYTHTADMIATHVLNK